MVKADSPDQDSSFSTIHAASPAGESPSATASVFGRVGCERGRVRRERVLRGNVRRVQGGHPARVLGREEFRDGATHIAAGR
ncbi:hypothetical protein GCM10009754_31070 [Amycolatopsis minnesotensis]|uniref:Uncharacterized protein n=1 Tax=Amycolatopsis minnesotensis TaxID=337894 RepID=A0ABP5C967_9PSEU